MKGKVEQGGGGELGVFTVEGGPMGGPTETRVPLREGDQVLERVVAQAGVLGFVGVERAKDGGGGGLAAGLFAKDVEHVVLERPHLTDRETFREGRVGNEGAHQCGLAGGEGARGELAAYGVDGFQAEGEREP